MIGERAEDRVGACRDRASGFGARFRQRSRWVLLTTLAALIVSCAFVLAVPPRYAGVARVLLDEKDGHLANTDQAEGGEPAAAIDDAAVRSRADADLARRAIDRLGLAANPEFAGSGGGERGTIDAFL